MRKRLVVYFTGGTICMRFDPAAGGAVPALSGREILESVPGLSDVADLEVIDFGRYPGPHMTAPLMLDLAAQVRASLSRAEVDGVVVTHGTDTLEETAYLLDLTIPGPKPVVVVGAMRNASELGWDGPPNLLAGARVAASPAAHGLGVLVVLNDTILAAAEATKTHTEAFDTFQSPDFGPVGVVDKGEVIVRRAPSRHAPHHLEATAMAEPVWLIKTTAAMDATIIDAAAAAGARGVVVEGLGRGNVPPACVPGIARAIDRGVPVVLTSRCMRGRVLPSYGYPGAGRPLKDLGVIFAPFLSGQKARVKLALALSLTTSPAALRALFEGNDR